MKYYLLNINRNGKSEVDYWLSERGIAPIFFNESTIDQIVRGEGHHLKAEAYKIAKLFVDTFRGEINSEAMIVSLGEDSIYFFRQKGQLQEFGLDVDQLIKGFEIEVIKEVPIKDAPLVLGSIKSNLYLASGTFRELSDDKYDGNTNAIKYLMGYKPIVVTRFEKYLQCLSSLEFETLIAKHLEEYGLFVPAYKGGFIKNFDLFCRNTTSNPISVYGKQIRPNDRIAVQIKLRLKKNDLDSTNDLFFCIWGEEQDSRIIDSQQLERNLKNQPKTWKWLEETLHWVAYSPEK